MDDKKISELPEITDVGNDNVIPIVAGDITAKVKISAIKTGLKGEKGDTGNNGVGIFNIEQTTKPIESQGINKIKVTTTDGAIRYLNIRNGEKGEKGDKGDAGEVTNIAEIVKQIKPLVLNSVHPIGSIFITMDNANPKDILGVGTWERIKSGLTLWSGDGTNTGTELEAGVPNITGALWIRNINGNAGPSGAFSHNGSANNWANFSPGNQTADRRYDIDASRSNPIYGKSDTVQPPALVVNIWRRVN